MLLGGLIPALNQFGAAAPVERSKAFDVDGETRSADSSARLVSARIIESTVCPIKPKHRIITSLSAA